MREKFSEYYKHQLSTIQPPSSIEKREFGFLLFDERIMLRHKSFKDSDALQGFLASLVPSDAYYSCAYYENPSAEMDKKDWLGADLIFDIDADHIPTVCNKVHDEWNCSDCGFADKGILPDKCPGCGSQKLEVKTWPCEVCLKSAKTETLKLLDMLMKDFGFHEKEIKLFFSGHRGYHVHVEDEAVRTLDSMARREIVDYVSSLGIDIILQGFYEKTARSPNILTNLSLNNSGWRGRIVRSIHDFVLTANEENYKNIGLEKRASETIAKNKDTLLKNWSEGKPLGIVKGVGVENWKKIIEFCAKSEAAKIDTVVTTDIHRLIRMTDTLHSKTGLKKVESSVTDIDNFDPFASAVAFEKGSTIISVSNAPKFRLGNEIFGPYKNQKIELPTAAAILLICKGRAEVVA